MSISLFDDVFRRASLVVLWDDDALLYAMLQAESALANAQAQTGLIPAAAAKSIAASCTLDNLDVPSLRSSARSAGNIAIPLVRQLTMAVRARDHDAAGYVHWGATSQDILDTALVLQLREHLQAIEASLAGACGSLVELIHKHRGTVLAGRTWMQVAVPTTLGLKLAGWLDALLRHCERLAELKPRILVAQLGGAVGTLASMGDSGLRVMETFAATLELAVPSLPWHTQRDRLAEVAAFHGILAGTLGKIARDLALAMQSEIAEVQEPHAEGRGGSSTMPHKRNPVASSVLLAAALRVPPLVSTMLTAMVQEQERGLGGWQAEWETLPEICLLAGSALEVFTVMLPGLNVDVEAMGRNLAAACALPMGEAVSMELARYLGKTRAHELVEVASRTAIACGTDLAAELKADASVMTLLSPERIDALLMPSTYLGSSNIFIDRTLERYDTMFGKPAGVR